MMNRTVLTASVVAAFAGLAFATPAMAQRQGKPNTADPNEGTVQTQSQPKQFPTGWAWSGVSVNGKPFGAERPTLTVDEALRGSGFGGCNTYSATMYPLREQGFAVGPLAVTKRACDKGLMEAEHAFLYALRTTQKWDLVAGRLVLKTGKGDIVFERSL